MIYRIEYLITITISDFLHQYDGNNKKINCVLSEQKFFNFFGGYKRIKRNLCYWSMCGRRRFALFLYVLAEVHDLCLFRSYCTYRQLYYRNVEIIGSTRLQIYKAVADASNVLNSTSWNLGIFSAGKCFVAGPLLIYMSNGGVIDCNTFKGPTSMPSNFTYIDKFETSANILLIVEKDTIFQYLVASDIFSTLHGRVIMLNARGYPDFCTRWILRKLSVENLLKFYVLVDGDPYGIEIMLVYRYGCFIQSSTLYNLNCPKLKWLGIHPSDFAKIVTTKEPMVKNDYDKIRYLLCRQHMSKQIRSELLMLDRQQYKIKIDNIPVHMFPKFINYYILQKIKKDNIFYIFNI